MPNTALMEGWGPFSKDGIFTLIMDGLIRCSLNDEQSVKKRIQCQFDTGSFFRDFWIHFFIISSDMAAPDNLQYAA